MDRFEAVLIQWQPWAWRGNTVFCAHRWGCDVERLWDAGEICCFLKYKCKCSQWGLAVLIILPDEGEAPGAEGVTEPSGETTPSNLALLFLLPWLFPCPFHTSWRFCCSHLLAAGSFPEQTFVWVFFPPFCLYFYLFYETQEANINTNTSRGLLIALALAHRLFSGSWAILQGASLLDFYLPFYSRRNRAWCCWEILILCSASQSAFLDLCCSWDGGEMKWEGAEHATNACVHFFPPHAMCAMCIFSLVFYGPEQRFRAEIIGLHIPEASYFFLGCLNNWDTFNSSVQHC